MHSPSSSSELYGQPVKTIQLLCGLRTQEEKGEVGRGRGREKKNRRRRKVCIFTLYLYNKNNLEVVMVMVVWVAHGVGISS